MSGDVPLIFTKHGNVPLDSVEQRVSWQFPPDMLAVCVDEWFDKATGESVKRSVYAYAKLSVADMLAQQGQPG